VPGKFKITYNAPVTLTFALAAVVVQLLPLEGKSWFVSYPSFDYGTRAYVGMVSHVLGHANWDHLLANFTLILLLGPILEERHGSRQLLAMILITAVVTGLINMLISDTMLIGASGIVFMLILLASTANIREREIPLTFIAVAVIYLGHEVVNAFKNDNISQLAHLVGGLAGGVFGFVTAKPGQNKGKVSDALIRPKGAVPGTGMGAAAKPAVAKPAAAAAAKPIKPA
jgi:membrane associated rhomboid family serine protease